MIPVWVKLRSLPLELWNQRALGKIFSKVGKPICTDQLTASRGRISYARVLVEVDAAKELVKEVSFKLPDGLMFHQDIEYDFSPKFCSHCKMIGHSLHDCKAIPAQKQLDRSSSEQESESLSLVTERLFFLTCRSEKRGEDQKDRERVVEELG
jgi:hypothetical protein